jgi:hypothetical protein
MRSICRAVAELSSLQQLIALARSAEYHDRKQAARELARLGASTPAGVLSELLHDRWDSAVVEERLWL